jgi:23S rRNA maturation mini-RNase III
MSFWKLLRGLKIFKGIGRYLKFGGIMAIAYAKLYELVYKYVQDKEKAEIISKAIEEFIKENEQRIDKRFEESKIIIKNELKDELKNELATKEDILLTKTELKNEIELVREEMKAMKEEILRYIDNKINQIKILIIIRLICYNFNNQNAIEVIKLIFGLR